MWWRIPLLALCLAAPARADEKQTGAILASLRMHDGAPVVDAKFSLRAQKGKKLEIARTDDRGRALFHTLAPGTSPHHHAMRPSEAGMLAEADLVVWVGHGLTRPMNLRQV